MRKERAGSRKKEGFQTKRWAGANRTAGGKSDWEKKVQDMEETRETQETQKATICTTILKKQEIGEMNREGWDGVRGDEDRDGWERQAESFFGVEKPTTKTGPRKTLIARPHACL